MKSKIFKIYGKKAVSEVVTVVLLILLTISIASILSLALIPFVKDNLAESSKCSDVLEGITITPEESCFDDMGDADPDNDETYVNIRRGNVDFEELYITLDGVSQNISTILLPQKGGGERLYTFNGIFTDANVGAIVGGKRCPVNDEIELKRC